ncbi:MAG: TonB-dependent receptor [Gemmatimonadota bacterium]
MTTSRTLRPSAGHIAAGFSIVIGVLAPCVAFAQVAGDSTRARPLAPVSVTVTRDAARSTFELPFATARVLPDSSRPGLRRSSIGELLLGVPGVIVQERANPSQDPRLAVRGFGARSAFGVRGVRVLRDGIPLSLPDGQTPIDWLDLETIGAIDVVRGTAAALYGNAAGGIVDFRSRAPELAPFALSSRVLQGAGVTRSNVTLSGTPRTARANADPGATPSAGWLASLTGTHGDGPREWSRVDASSGFARGFATVRGTRVEVQGTVYDAPRAENTGALTAGELAADPTLPDSLNVQRRSRKAVQQSQFAVIASRTNGANEWSASAFASARQLDNPLPFAIVDVDRNVAGASVRGTRRVTALPWPLRLTAGGDFQQQDDERLNFENCADVLPTAPVTVRCPVASQERGAVRLDQRETVEGTGVFARLEVEAPGRVFASAALRHDRVGFSVQDRFTTATNPDDSGERTLSASSPMFAVVWRARPLLSVYVNVARAFETPTVTELTNQDDGSAGLNTRLAPQRTSTVEVGAQSLLAGVLQVDVALFSARVRDELVAFDVPNAPGRRAFRNAGRTSRDGVELSLASRATLPGAVTADMGLGYTLSRFRYDQYQVGAANFSGNSIPGIPDQQLQAFATARRGGTFGTIDVTAASRATADDAATVQAAGYAVWALRAGHRVMVQRRFSIEPMAGVENLFDRRFAGSVVVNATRARFFEPGGRRRGYVGVRVGAQ